MKGCFKKEFQALTEVCPFKWQERLYDDFMKGNVPIALDIPTGLGKTSVMTVWYLAWKAGADIPRRLVYIVDRRAVVDQATTLAEQIKKKASDQQLQISTLRGQYVDNREWLADPSSSTIVVGTVDMIGSRLLFSGYGVSWKMRPYHAGLLGADTLFVLDEAHLVPPFEELLKSIANCSEFSPRPNSKQLIPPLKLLSLSATGRHEGQPDGKLFRLSPEEKEEDVVKKRLVAEKQLNIQVLDDHNQLVDTLTEKAWELGNDSIPSRVLVYCDRREDALKVETEINRKIKHHKKAAVVQLLVGGRRVFEREKLSEWLNSHGFLGGSDKPCERPTFLIATSAGEVGVDLDSNHMVSDLVEWERMVQRFGRVNRRGNGKSQIKIVAAPGKSKPKANASNKVKDDYQKEMEKLECLCRPLDKLRPVNSESEKMLRDGSPGAILDLKSRGKTDQQLQQAVTAATTAIPLYPALTRALVDAWSLTSLDKHTGRPADIQPWLRGWEDESKQQTTVIWRKYLPVRKCGPQVKGKEVEAFFGAAPPHTSERLETETYRVSEWLDKRAKKIINKKSEADVETEQALHCDDIVAYVLSPVGGLRKRIRMKELVTLTADVKKKLKKELIGATVVVDYRFCGLSEEGILDEKVASAPRAIDDGEEWLPLLPNGEPTIRFRIRAISVEEDARQDEWRERHRFTVNQTEEGEAQAWLCVEKWRHDAETEEDRSVGRLQTLEEHHAWTECKAHKLAKAIKLSPDYADMLTTAARLHDEGKRHKIWQRAVKAPIDEKVYAKTNRAMNTRILDGYRHEFGSLPFAENDSGLQALSQDLRDLTLHLIASHHGGARPVIGTNGCDEPPSLVKERSRQVTLRFARLQKQWGPWGLAWWEALLRAADQQASRDNDSGELTP